jgi:hypothetical protein
VCVCVCGRRSLDVAKSVNFARALIFQPRDIALSRRASLARQTCRGARAGAKREAQQCAGEDRRSDSAPTFAPPREGLTPSAGRAMTRKRGRETDDAAGPPIEADLALAIVASRGSVRSFDGDLQSDLRAVRSINHEVEAPSLTRTLERQSSAASSNP